MHPEGLREAGLDGKFSRHTVLSLLIFAVVWEVLSHFAPALGIPAFAIPSFVRISPASGCSMASWGSAVRLLNG